MAETEPRGRRHAACRLAVAALGLFAAVALVPDCHATSTTTRPRPGMTKVEIKYEPAAFADLPGWNDDDHLAAFATFLKSCERLAVAEKSSPPSKSAPSPELAAACATAVSLAAGPKAVTGAAARAFFEQAFTPHRVVHTGPAGLLTGYYEPVVAGSRTPSKRFAAPLYRRPVDLVNLVEESQRGAAGAKLTHARALASGATEPYPTRAEIEQGALAGLGLELLYLEDAVEAFFMQVQGSGRVRLEDGSEVRVTYDGKNGHPYSSIGRYLIDQGILNADKMSLKALETWLRANPEKAREVMWQNASFVFFRELKGKEAEGPIGVLEIPLTPGRSLAVDAGYHAIGAPVYVSSPRLTHATAKGKGFARLMIAQDVGSAIKGPERGDIYFGSGDDAGKLAGITKHPGTFFVLVPRELAVKPTDLIALTEPARKLIRQARQ